MNRVKSYFTSLFKSKSNFDPWSVLVLCNECMNAVQSPNNYHRCVECLEVYDLCESCLSQGKGTQHTDTHGDAHYFYTENKPLNTLLKELNQTQTLESLYFNAFKIFSTRPAFGKYEAENNRFVYITFAEVFHEIEMFASGLLEMGIVRCNSQGIIPDQIISVSSVVRSEFVIADLALMFLGVASAPITVSDDVVNFSAILSQTEVETVICSKQVLNKVYTAINENRGNRVQCIVCMDDVTGTVVPHQSVRLVEWRQVCEKGREHLVELKSFKTSKESIFTLVYTSGSTGTPKGCIFTRQTYFNSVKGSLSVSGLCDVWLAFQPPSHQMERRAILCNICSGIRVAFYRGDMACIMEDIFLVKPTTIACTPRFWSSLYQHYRLLVDREYNSIHNSAAQDPEDSLDGVKKALGEVLNSDNLPVPNEETPPASQSADTTLDISNSLRDIEIKMLEKLSGILGGRTREIVTGGAPTSPEVLKFLNRCFDCHIRESYGATEVGGIASEGFISAGAEVKLVDVPDMGYLGSDNPPRGEICVRTAEMIKGYYKNEKETEEKFVDGFFRTGDIGVIEKKGNIKIIDRKKNLFKLAQGEFISPERIEGIFCSNSNYIKQMFVYGESLWNSPVCVVVPNKDYVIVSALATSHMELSYSQLCSTAGLLDSQMMQEIKRVSSESGLSQWEIPVAVLIEETEFSATNNLLTATLKHCRPRLSMKYQDGLSEIYAAEETKLNTITQNRMLDVVSQVLPLDSSSISLESSFSELGGDSLSAVSLMMLIKSELNVEISVKELLQCPLSQLGDFVTMHSRSLPRQSAGSADSTNKSKERSIPVDFKAETQLEPSFFSDTKTDAYNPVWRSQKLNCMQNCEIVCFLTGASGFLGRHILADILNLTQWQVVCLVRRARDGTPGDIRLNQEMSEILEEVIYDTAYSRRVRVMEGDLSKPNIGMSSEDVQFLTNSVDVIVHNGNRVSFVLPYTQLVAPNVNSLRFLLSVCSQATHKPKHLHFVSTLGVLDIWTKLPDYKLLNETSTHDTAYIALANGYVQSKFVCEVMLKRAAELGLSASVSRPGLIGPHTVTGDTNLRDWSTYLVYSLFKLGLSPFSPTDSSLKTRISHIPVDYVARAILYISVLSEESTKLVPFHLASTVANNFSLQQILNSLNDTLNIQLTSVSFPEFLGSLATAAKHDVRLRAAALLYENDTLTLKPSLQVSTIQARTLLEPVGVTYPIPTEEYYKNMGRFLHKKMLVKSETL